MILVLASHRITSHRRDSLSSDLLKSTTTIAKKQKQSSSSLLKHNNDHHVNIVEAFIKAKEKIMLNCSERSTCAVR